MYLYTVMRSEFNSPLSFCDTSVSFYNARVIDRMQLFGHSLVVKHASVFDTTQLVGHLQDFCVRRDQLCGQARHCHSSSFSISPLHLVSSPFSFPTMRHAHLICGSVLQCVAVCCSMLQPLTLVICAVHLWQGAVLCCRVLQPLSLAPVRVEAFSCRLFRACACGGICER